MRVRLEGNHRDKQLLVVSSDPSDAPAVAVFRQKLMS